MRPDNRNDAQSPDRASTALGVSDAGRVIGGQQWLDAFSHAALVIANHRDQLNALNVFPVPDGDTGTNMSLTLKSAVEAANQIGQGQSPAVSAVASKIAFGALMGARGNSGVILSQILRGFSTAFEGKDDIGAADIASALANATTVAYKAVVNPVEGTMLTVIAEASRAATAAADQTDSVVNVCIAAADGAEIGLRRTPELLDILRQANVVDSGGQGIAYMLRAMANAFRGDLTDIQIGESNPTPDLGNIASEVNDAHSGQKGYCTNFIVAGESIDIDIFRARLEISGNSVVVVGDESLLKAHVHTKRPDEVLALALACGRLDRVSIDNMDRQIEDILTRASQPPQSTTIESDIIGKHAVVTVTDGPGLARALLSVGATSVIQLLNDAKPSTEELLRAVEAAKSDDVVLLPNASETMAAANIVIGLSNKRVRIVPSLSFAAGLGALSAMSGSAGMDANVSSMTAALKSAVSIEIATAARDARIDNVAVRAGELLLFVNSAIKTCGRDLGNVLRTGLETLESADIEMCTVFTGKNAVDDDIAVVRSALELRFPAAELELVEGGQTHYDYIIAFE